MTLRFGVRLHCECSFWLEGFGLAILKRAFPRTDVCTREVPDAHPATEWSTRRGGELWERALVHNRFAEGELVECLSWNALKWNERCDPIVVLSRGNFDHTVGQNQCQPIHRRASRSTAEYDPPLWQ